MTTPPNDPGQGQPSGTFGPGGTPGPRRASQYPDFGPSQPSQWSAQQPQPGQPAQRAQPAFNYYAAPPQPQPGPPQHQPGPSQPQPQPSQPQARLRQGPQFVQGAGAPTAQPKDPAQVKRRRLIALIVIGVLILGIGAFAAISWSSARTKEREANAAMSGLLTALQAGDAATALGYLDIDPSLADSQPLLSDEAIAGNPDVFSFNPAFVTKHSGGVYSQQASIQINDVTRVVEWQAKKIDGTWKIDPAAVLGQVSLTYGQSVQINGIRVGPGPVDLAAFPGSYKVESGLALLSYAPGQADFDVFTAGRTTIDADLIVADGVQQQVADQVREILSGCVAEKASPGACNWTLGFTNGHAVDGTINWTLSPEDPAAQLTIPTTGWSAAEEFIQIFPVRYQTSASGEGELDEGGRGTFEDYTANRTTYFDVDLSGDTPKVTLVV